MLTPLSRGSAIAEVDVRHALGLVEGREVAIGAACIGDREATAWRHEPAIGAGQQQVEAGETG